MVGTPIYDELRDLFATSPGRFGSQPRAKPASLGAPKPPTKILVTGGAGVGKTTFLGAVSDTHPITVEAATDFGRITLNADLVLYLFGTSEPGQPAFADALGAVVLVDPRRIEAAFPAISFFESGSGIPFIVAVNMIDGAPAHELDEVREALALPPRVPLLTCDARNPGSAANVLQTLITYTLNLAP